LKKIFIAIVIGTYLFGGLATPVISLAADETPTVTSNTATVSDEAEKEAISAALMGMNQTLMEGMIFGAALGLMAVGIATGSDGETPQAHDHGHGH
jgi:hypothetical protein